MNFNHSEDLSASLLESKDKRQQLARQIFQEIQEGCYQSSMGFFQALNQELGNTSDQAIDIMLRQRGMFDQ
ncbi:hypothetical protein JMM81_11615 [Bacillus sp. V3B]|uniref:hypothetical protein n=1 Tax=Bacillus sp. V3B TaxID=2804915 RepID=UPI00210C04AC|nr:hypothetical protein [Bacillus sp. V3B]MCQ6275605.1 hypothetical protein [Bacillus sp. V3B]